MSQLFNGLGGLFAQMGMPSDSKFIEGFVDEHRDEAAGAPLCEAPFWTPSQSAFLREAIAEDADWAWPVDELDGWLHERPHGPAPSPGQAEPS